MIINAVMLLYRNADGYIGHCIVVQLNLGVTVGMKTGQGRAGRGMDVAWR